MSDSERSPSQTHRYADTQTHRHTDARRHQHRHKRARAHAQHTHLTEQGCISRGTWFWMATAPSSSPTLYLSLSVSVLCNVCVPNVFLMWLFGWQLHHLRRRHCISPSLCLCCAYVNPPSLSLSLSRSLTLSPSRFFLSVSLPPPLPPPRISVLPYT